MHVRCVGATRPCAHRAPLVDALRELGRKERALDHPFYFPGHKRGSGSSDSLKAIVGQVALQHDLPELPELDNLFCPTGAIKEAQEMAAEAFGARETFFLVNGTTCGIQAAVMTLCNPGNTLVLPRNSHQAAFSAMVLAGAIPYYLEPELDVRLDLTFGVTAEMVQEGIRNAAARDGGQLPAAVLVTSPTYHGACLDLKSIARVCQTHGVPLIVDEAHGAHFKFHPDLPTTALEAGADIAVQSTHKVLTSMTQASMLHVGSRKVDRDRLALSLQTLQSSSPSYLLLASLDAARQQLQEHGTTLLHESIALAHRATKSLESIPNIDLLRMESIHAHSVIAIDPLRITVGLDGLDLNGFSADDYLREFYSVTCELPLSKSLTFAIGPGNTTGDIDALVLGVSKIAGEFAPPGGDAKAENLPVHLSSASWGCARVPPREAFYAQKTRVALEDAAGRVSAELLCPYPPGIPVVTPGEEITPAALSLLQEVLASGGSVSGASDPDLREVLVLQ